LPKPHRPAMAPDALVGEHICAGAARQRYAS
jgi:hypothetical protein